MTGLPTPTPKRISRGLRSLFLAPLMLLVFMPEKSQAQAVEIQNYLKHIVGQEWSEAVKYIDRDSLQRRKLEYVNMVKGSNLLREEEALLERLGATSLREVEEMTPEEFYTRERAASYQGKPLTPATIKRRSETLTVKFLGQALEGDDITHVVVRSRQETLESVIDELLMISCKKDKSGMWKIVPDMQRTKVTPLIKPGEGG